VNYIREAQKLVKNINNVLAPSPYDNAWLARLRLGKGQEPLWPDLIDWLLETQYPDGSWGSPIAYYHDRIISTLAAAIALGQNGRTKKARDALRQAERYLWHHLHLLPRDPFELVGFELILPTMLNEAREMGLDVPTHTCGYGEIQTAKLRMIPPDMLYSPYISTVLSLEFLGKSGDPGRLQQALTVNGSLGNSPAATAYYLTLCEDLDAHALQYLKTVRAAMGYAVPFYPFRTFELTWVLNNLVQSGMSIRDFSSDDIWQELQTQIAPRGVGFDPSFRISDGDTTAACCRVLLEAGHSVDPLILAQFEDREKRIFRTYHYERNPSITTNIHALDALQLISDYPNHREVKEQVILMLLENRQYNMYWTDKWHASPYYATAHALLAFLKEGDYLAHACSHTVDWILHTQQEDGSWGFFEQSTVEETAYALTALLHYHRHEPLDPQVMHRAAAYLARTHRGPASTYPPLWIAKSLFAPHDIIRAAVLAALILYKDTFGRSP
jgi:halimadienyl-diphosphate synthase